MYWRGLAAEDIEQPYLGGKLYKAITITPFAFCFHRKLAKLFVHSGGLYFHFFTASKIDACLLPQ
jgi:hypothetical protein